MPMQMLTPSASIAAYLNSGIQRIEKAVIRLMCVAGEQCVNVAREKHSYKDQTGNLTSSIGYVVAIDGKIVQMSSFEVVKDGEQGSKDGKAYAKELVKQNNKGIVLIIVAGKEYASYVSDRGYDVLDSAELEADRLVPILLRQLKL